MKQCIKCNETKELTEFYKDSRTPGKYRASCKPCMKAAKGDYSQYWKDRWKRTKEDKEWLLAEQIRKAEYSSSERGKQKQKEWLENNRESYRNKRRAYERTYYSNKYQNDINYRLKTVVSVAVRNALKGNTKGGKTFDYLPYTPEQLKEHLEKQFQPGMSWDNYGEWEIDHIFPQSLLPYDSLDHPNFQRCWALENLQPLGKIENIIKSNKII